MNDFNKLNKLQKTGFNKVFSSIKNRIGKYIINFDVNGNAKVIILTGEYNARFGKMNYSQEAYIIDVNGIAEFAVCTTLNTEQVKAFDL